MHGHAFLKREAWDPRGAVAAAKHNFTRLDRAAALLVPSVEADPKARLHDGKRPFE